MEWIFGIIILIIIIIAFLLFNVKEKYNDKEDYYNPDKQLWVYKNILTEEDCNDIIKTANKIGMNNSEIKNYELDTKSRISQTCWIDYKTNKTVEKLYDKIEKILGKSKQDFEMLQVVKYNTNGFFTWHYDQCNDKEKWCQKEIKRLKGYRLFTILIYLNDDYENGETIFRNNKKNKLKKGDALIFRNVNLDNCKIEYESFHTGSKITRGEKWICNIWIRGYCNKTN